MNGKNYEGNVLTIVNRMLHEYEADFHRPVATDRHTLSKNIINAVSLDYDELVNTLNNQLETIEALNQRIEDFKASGLLPITTFQPLNYEHLIGDTWRKDGFEYTLIGIIFGKDDWYWVMKRGTDAAAHTEWLSCVCNIEAFGYEKIDG